MDHSEEEKPFEQNTFEPLGLAARTLVDQLQRRMGKGRDAVPTAPRQGSRGRIKSTNDQSRSSSSDDASALPRTRRRRETE
jgi:hypothetical protein